MINYTNLEKYADKLLETDFENFNGYDGFTREEVDHITAYIGMKLAEETNYQALFREIFRYNPETNTCQDPKVYESYIQTKIDEDFEKNQRIIREIKPPRE